MMIRRRRASSFLGQDVPTKSRRSGVIEYCGGLQFSYPYVEGGPSCADILSERLGEGATAASMPKDLKDRVPIDLPQSQEPSRCSGPLPCPATASANAHLLRLPTELLECIASYLDPSDLSTLRLVCRELYTRLTPTFARLFFRDRCFLLSDSISMRTLAQISRHDVFVKTMRHIRFAPMKLWSNRRLGDIRLWDLDPAVTREERALRRKYRQIQEDLKNTEREFRGDWLTDILVEVFLNFQSAGNAPKISFVPGFWEDPGPGTHRPIGLTRLQQLLGYKECLRAQGDGRYHIAVLVAMITADYSPPELDVGQKQHEVSISWFSYPMAQYSSVNLRLLQLFLQFDGIYGADIGRCAARRRDIHGFVSFIAGAVNLEHFLLQLEHSRDNRDVRRDVFHSLATKTFLDGTPLGLRENCQLVPKLKVLKLENHLIEPDLLVDFCRERRDALQEVRLSNILHPGHTDVNIMERIWDLVKGGPEKMNPCVGEYLCYGEFEGFD